MKKIFIITVIIIVKISTILAQDVMKMFNEQIESEGSIYLEYIKPFRDNKEIILKELANYYQNKDIQKRNMAYSIRFYIAGDNDNEMIKVVEFYTTTLVTPNNGVEGTIISNLRNIKREYYSEKSISNLLQITKSDRINEYNNDLIKIMGSINLKEVMPYFIKKLSIVKKENIMPYGNNWAMYLALAKMGDSDAIDFCAKKFQSYIKSGRSGNYIGDIIYMKNQMSIELLSSMLAYQQNINEGDDINNNSLAMQSYTILCELVQNLPENLRNSNKQQIFSIEKIKNMKTWIDAQPKNTIKIKEDK